MMMMEMVGPEGVIIRDYTLCTQVTHASSLALGIPMMPSGNHAVEEGYEVCRVWAGQDIGL